MRISDWSSDVCSSDLLEHRPRLFAFEFIFVEIARLLVREIVELVERFTLGAVQQVRPDGADREIAADPFFDENFEVGAIGGADFLADPAVIGRALLAVRCAKGGDRKSKHLNSRQ